MTSIIEINRKAGSFALGGAKTPHSVSWPVLRKKGSRLVIAYYTTAYNKEKLDSGLMPRPMEWMELDIRDGNLIGRYDCRAEDFSKQPFDKMYDISKKSGVRIDAAAVESLYKMFDSVRKAYIENKMLDLLMYRKYLNTVCAVIPESYRGFLKELSV